MKKMKLNENTIFTTRPGKFLAWNLDTGEQFEIFEKRYLDRVYELATHQSNTVESQAEDHDLVEAGLVKTVEKDSALPEERWGWDDIAKIFHLGSKHNFPSDLSTPDENPEEGYVEFGDAPLHFQDCRTSKYMLTFHKVIDDRLQAITHIDGTARVQTITREDNPNAYDLLKSFKAVSGVGVLCNTSLNFNGAGFINNHIDLENFCIEKNINAYVINDVMYLRRGVLPA